MREPPAENPLVGPSTHRTKTHVLTTAKEALQSSRSATTSFSSLTCDTASRPTTKLSFQGLLSRVSVTLPGKRNKSRTYEPLRIRALSHESAPPRHHLLRFADGESEDGHLGWGHRTSERKGWDSGVTTSPRLPLTLQHAAIPDL